MDPNTANENEIVDWDLRQFSSFTIENKLLLLQYGIPDTTNVADVAEEFMSSGGHHTLLGNEVICSYLFEHGFQRETPLPSYS